MLPRVNDDVNEEWASDKTRHHVDGLVRQPPRQALASGATGRFSPRAGMTRSRPARREGADCSVAADGRRPADCETMFAAASLVKALGAACSEGRQSGPELRRHQPLGGQFQYRHRRPRGADVILINGTNLRWKRRSSIRVPSRRPCARKAPRSSPSGREADLSYKTTLAGRRCEPVSRLPKDVLDAFAGARVPADHGAAAALPLTAPMARRWRWSTLVWAGTGGTASTSCIAAAPWAR